MLTLIAATIFHINSSTYFIISAIFVNTPHTEFWDCSHRCQSIQSLLNLYSHGQHVFIFSPPLVLESLWNCHLPNAFYFHDKLAIVVLRGSSTSRLHLCFVLHHHHHHIPCHWLILCVITSLFIMFIVCVSPTSVACYSVSLARAHFLRFVFVFS